MTVPEDDEDDDVAQYLTMMKGHKKSGLLTRVNKQPEQVCWISIQYSCSFVPCFVPDAGTAKCKHWCGFSGFFYILFHCSIALRDILLLLLFLCSLAEGIFLLNLIYFSFLNSSNNSDKIDFSSTSFPSSTEVITFRFVSMSLRIASSIVFSPMK